MTKGDRSATSLPTCWSAPYGNRRIQRIQAWLIAISDNNGISAEVWVSGPWLGSFKTLAEHLTERAPRAGAALRSR